MATQPHGPDEKVQFIGAPIQDVIKNMSQVLSKGQYHDGTSVAPHAREALSAFSKALEPHAAKWRYYIFVWTRHIFIIIDF